MNRVEMLGKNIIKFNSDTKHRKQWFTGLSFSHPAKMSLPLQIWLIENFTKEGETILDPMAGSGTIMVACSMGRNVICVELEQKFVDVMKGNWKKIQQRGYQLGYSMGMATILQGDARNLTGILADKCIFSPPYEGIIDGSGEGPLVTSKRNKTYKPMPSSYSQVDAVIASPPYEGTVQPSKPLSERTDKTAEFLKADRPFTYEKSGSGLLIKGYSKNLENIGNLKSASYLEAMLQVYQQCYQVLKDGGLMVLVTKNFIRNKAIVRLDMDTIKLCEQAGFTFKDRWYRELASQSFWRTIYYKKFPDVEPIKFEDVLIFQR